MMRTIQTADAESYRRMTTGELSSRFLISDLFQQGSAQMVYTDIDRAVVGGVVPTKSSLALEGSREMACNFFCERREVGVINLGASGTATVDGVAYHLASRECIYIGRGSREVHFASDAAQTPAMFYLVSYPAHTDYPTAQARLDQAFRLEFGSPQEANRRTIHQYIRPGGIRSCQLVMGFTELHEGSVWNTFPPHTHDRRTEVYCYFDLLPQGCVVHILGKPDETRHLVVREKQVVLAPPWSIHSGVGTGRYRFVWAMGGENQVFEDMDLVDRDRLS
jgi:4-deoxy-L-threo-5-hexosulose-uronate ketol-isomerase